MKPAVFSVSKNSLNNTNIWERAGNNVKYEESKVYKVVDRPGGLVKREEGKRSSDSLLLTCLLASNRFRDQSLKRATSTCRLLSLPSMKTIQYSSR